MKDIKELQLEVQKKLVEEKEQRIAALLLKVEKTLLDKYSKIEQLRCEIANAEKLKLDIITEFNDKLTFDTIHYFEREIN